MKKYNYMETVKTDAVNWTRKNVNMQYFESLDSVRRYTLSKLSHMDSVTGGDTGKYTGTEYSIKETTEHVEQNIELYYAAIKEMTSPDPRDEPSTEEMNAFYKEETNIYYCDCTIRLYCLYEIIDSIILEAFAPTFKKPEKYDYMKAVKKDVMDWTRENIDFSAVDDIAELKNYILYNTLEDDYITGGETYIYRPYRDDQEVKRGIGENLDLLVDAILDIQAHNNKEDAQEWLENYKDDPDMLDAMIRCYLLPSAIDQVVTELLPEIEKSQASAS